MSNLVEKENNEEYEEEYVDEEYDEEYETSNNPEDCLDCIYFNECDALDAASGKCRNFE